VPRPESGTVCGLPGALSVIEIEAVRNPCAVGENVTLMRQLAPAATVGGQLLDWAKSPSSGPVMVMPVMPAADRVNTPSDHLTSKIVECY
jgi:hypothetical protein